MPRMSRASAVRVVLHHGDGFGAIGLEDPHRAEVDTPWACRNTMISRMTFWSAQPDVIFPGPLFADDAINLAQARGCLLDDVEDRRAEGADQARLGVNRADAFDHARAEVALDAAEGVRPRDLDEHGPGLACRVRGR